MWLHCGWLGIEAALSTCLSSRRGSVRRILADHGAAGLLTRYGVAINEPVCAQGRAGAPPPLSDGLRRPNGAAIEGTKGHEAIKKAVFPTDLPDYF